MTEQQPIEAPARERPTIRRETPQRPRKRRQPWLGVAAIGASVLVAVAVGVIVLGTGSAHPVVPHTQPVVTPPRPVVTTGRTVVTPPPSHAAAAGAVAAVSSYWQSIGRHDFAAAYAALLPGAVPQTEAQWVPIEQQTGIESVHFAGRATSSTATDATVQVLSLVTQDLRFGCRTWTGTYSMINQAGRWLITRANIIPAQCSP